MKKKRLLIVT